jgi:hypothetical protein
MALFCTPQQYFAQAYHCWPLCFLISSGNETSHTVKQQNIACAIYEGQQMSVWFKKVIADEGSFKDEPMQTEAMTCIPDNLQLDTYFQDSIVAQLPWKSQKQLTVALSTTEEASADATWKQLGYNYSWTICLDAPVLILNDNSGCVALFKELSLS